MPFTLAILKPDAVANPLVLKWVSASLFKHGMKVTRGCRLRLTREQACKLYESHAQKFFFGRLIRHVCSGTSIVMKLELVDQSFNEKELPWSVFEEASQEHDNWYARMIRSQSVIQKTSDDKNAPNDEVIKRWRAILGSSKLFSRSCSCLDLLENSDLLNLRTYFSLSDTRNVGHGSDSVEELEKEIQIFDDLLKDVSDADHELFQLYSFTSPDCDTEYSSDFA